MAVSPEITTPIGGPEPQPQKGRAKGKAGPSEEKAAKAAKTTGVPSSPTGEVIPADISRLQPPPSPESKPELIRETAVAGVESRSKKRPRSEEEGDEEGKYQVPLEKKARIERAEQPMEVEPLKEVAVAGVETRSEKGTEKAVKALVQEFKKKSSPCSTLLRTFLDIPCQALQNLKKVNPELHAHMVNAVLRMIRTGDRTEILGVFDNDKDLVQALTEVGSDVNWVPDKRTDPPLCRAASSEFESKTGDKLIRILVGLGAEVNKKGRAGESPLYRAVCMGRTETVRLLASLGADFNLPNYEEETPLREALLNKKSDMIHMLLSLHAAFTSADLNQPKFGETPLYSAVRHGDEEKVRLLVSLGADINQPGWKDRSPLCEAFFGGSLSMIKLLLELGAQARSEDVNYLHE